MPYFLVERMRQVKRAKMAVIHCFQQPQCSGRVVVTWFAYYKKNQCLFFNTGTHGHTKTIELGWHSRVHLIGFSSFLQHLLQPWCSDLRCFALIGHGCVLWPTAVGWWCCCLLMCNGSVSALTITTTTTDLCSLLGWYTPLSLSCNGSIDEHRILHNFVTTNTAVDHGLDVILYRLCSALACHHLYRSI